MKYIFVFLQTPCHPYWNQHAKKIVTFCRETAAAFSPGVASLVICACSTLWRHQGFGLLYKMIKNTWQDVNQITSITLVHEGWNTNFTNNKNTLH